ncbi:uncharacterized protein LOC132554162 [Ylistrum balloti]|uniref:uncharacterized protein LOC132554162 n=1 Tax=Ylistrum balloti TaxID=509963 RepID=UPI002905A812|nr:uncharacterized protein LOC132554162 [Ylistrum balloti]
MLSYFNTSLGVIPIVNKLPYNIQEKWTMRAARFKREHGVSFPPFSCFTEFVREMSKVKNDPGFVYDSQTNAPQFHKKGKPNVSAMKTDVMTMEETASQSKCGSKIEYCHLHNAQGHSLSTCRSFRSKPLTVRKKFIKDKGLCFKCCSSNHKAEACNQEVCCDVCKKPHLTALHIDGGELRNSNSKDHHTQRKLSVNTACAQVCGDSLGKSCAKIVQVIIHPKDKPRETLTTYAIIDDQSNRSLVSPDFFDKFEGDFPEVNYSLSSCGGVVDTLGRRAYGFLIRSIDGKTAIELPPLTECEQIPDVRDEIPTPDIARRYKHLQDIAENIPEADNTIPILLLIGRDLIEAHHVQDQRIGPRGSPYAQRLSLGWVIVGEACLGKAHAPHKINCMKTYVHKGARGSIFPPCDYQFHLKETSQDADIFRCTANDNEVGLSAEDKEFLKIMNKEFIKSSDGNWTAPLPFRTPTQRLPNNRNYALKRATNLQNGLRKNPAKGEHFIEFMAKILDNGYAELAPSLEPNQESWFLPIFGVYHKKKGQIRVVFDSSATYQGVSLNSVLLQGPDMTNNFWDNDLNLELVEYNMCVHVFGNSPSPAIATYGLRKSAADQESTFGSDMKDFMEKNFYVDDGLVSFADSTQAIDLLQRTREALRLGGKLRLHKIASNDSGVMKAFPKEDLAADLKVVDIGSEHLPPQRSLGLMWNLNTDRFTFNVSDDDKTFTRRGMLSVINSLYDPLGFISPIIVQGRILIRDFIAETVDWDLPLSEESLQVWMEWRESLKHLDPRSVPRTYFPSPFDDAGTKEIHIFGDASEKVISAVAYLKRTNADSSVDVGFVLGKSKVAPKSGHTIPRLELCAAVLAVEIGEIVSRHLDFPLSKMKFYSDSRVVLGYLNNKVRRFFVYVENRVSRILKSTERHQWHYVASENNPADQGTRPISSTRLDESTWLKGPEFLRSENPPGGEEQRRGHVPVSSAISSLDPYLDDKGMLRLGGRIKQMNADLKEKNPLILPGNHHISTLLVRHYHEKVKHMGRHFTDGAVRSAGIWITGVKRLISSLIYRCVI